MKSIAIIQARMSSTRLPGKVLINIEGKQVLMHVAERLRNVELVDQVIIATTVNHDDDQLVKWCDKHEIECFRGDCDDVLARFYHCAKKYRADEIVRVTSDNPLVDSDIVNKTIKMRRQNNADYAANNLEKSYPHGHDIEVITFNALEEAYIYADKQPEREHVTQYVRHRPEHYTLVNLHAGEFLNDIRITLDEDEDRQLIELVFRLLGSSATFKDIVTLFSSFPALKNVNSAARDRHRQYNKEQNVI